MNGPLPPMTRDKTCSSQTLCCCRCCCFFFLQTKEHRTTTSRVPRPASLAETKRGKGRGGKLIRCIAQGTPTITHDQPQVYLHAQLHTRVACRFVAAAIQCPTSSFAHKHWRVSVYQAAPSRESFPAAYQRRSCHRLSRNQPEAEGAHAHPEAAPHHDP